jgi:hypothetical protein
MDKVPKPSDSELVTQNLTCNTVELRKTAEILDENCRPYGRDFNPQSFKQQARAVKPLDRNWRFHYGKRLRYDQAVLRSECADGKDCIRI